MCSSLTEMPVSRAAGAARTIVVDVGKSFLPAAVEWFPKYGLRHIDAVLITHAHADGMFGPDLRACVRSLHTLESSDERFG